MTIWIINNYPDKKDLHRIEKIKGILHGLGKSDLVVRDFNNMDTQPIPMDVEAAILSGSNMHLDKQKDSEKYQAEIEFVRKVDIPILGICFGHQLIGVAFGSKVRSISHYIQGSQKVRILQPNDIFSTWKKGEIVTLCQNHKDNLSALPKDFDCLAESQSCKIEAMKHHTKPIYGIQAHIERAADKNLDGLKVFRNFIENVVEKSTITRIAKTKSLSEIKQAMIDVLRDIQYDITREDIQKAESKLKNAQKYVDAWTKKKVVDPLVARAHIMNSSLHSDNESFLEAYSRANKHSLER